MNKQATPRIQTVCQDLLLTDIQIGYLERKKEDYINVIKAFMGEEGYELTSPKGILLVRWKPYTEHRFDLEAYKRKHYQTYLKYLKETTKRPFKYKF